MFCFAFKENVGWFMGIFLLVGFFRFLYGKIGLIFYLKFMDSVIIGGH